MTAPAIGAVVATRPPVETETVFEAEGVSIYYGDFRAVTDVSFDIQQYEITAFIGPSGCGKTTVLRTLNRMNDLVDGARVEGDVKYHGASLYGPGVSAAAVRRRIGMVFQKPNPFPKSIRENLAFPLRIHGLADGIDVRIEQALRRAALWDEVKDRLGKSALELSGGQQQRLCIARALVTEPEVLLMDEPCSSLDPGSTARVEDLIQELAQRYTVVIVTHNMQQAARVSHHTAFFYLGRLEEFGGTRELFSKPAKQRTEEYITGRFG
jgi:phosphate transport system ATP-binding protein